MRRSFNKLQKSLPPARIYYRATHAIVDILRALKRNKGVKRVFEILENELITAMKNAGFKNLAEMKKNRLKF